MKTKKEPKFRSVKRAYNYAVKNNCKLNLNNEKLIATDGGYSYFYACTVLKDSFELGEEAISKITHFSFNYAESVLKSRFKLGEEAIINNIFADCFYYSLYIECILNYFLPVDFLESHPIIGLEYLIDKCREEVKNIDDVIKVLFKKKLLANE